MHQYWLKRTILKLRHGQHFPAEWKHGAGLEIKSRSMKVFLAWPQEHCFELSHANPGASMGLQQKEALLVVVLWKKDPQIEAQGSGFHPWQTCNYVQNKRNVLPDRCLKQIQTDICGFFPAYPVDLLIKKEEASALLSQNVSSYCICMCMLVYIWQKKLRAQLFSSSAVYPSSYTISTEMSSQ